MDCPLCYASTTLPGWWCNVFLKCFPKFRLDIGELVYHLKVNHPVGYFNCPCGFIDPLPPNTRLMLPHETEPAVLTANMEALCRHFMSLDDVVVHLQYHAMGNQP